MKKRIYIFIIFFAISHACLGKPVIDYHTLPIELINKVLDKDTIPSAMSMPSSIKAKQKKKSWLPKIRLRFLVLLFKEKLKERDKRKRKPVYPIVYREKKNTNIVRTK